MKALHSSSKWPLIPTCACDVQQLLLVAGAGILHACVSGQHLQGRIVSVPLHAMLLRNLGQHGQLVLPWWRLHRQASAGGGLRYQIL